jgi:hypothetical protein
LRGTHRGEKRRGGKSVKVYRKRIPASGRIVPSKPIGILEDKNDKILLFIIIISYRRLSIKTRFIKAGGTKYRKYAQKGRIKFSMRLSCRIDIRGV